MSNVQKAKYYFLAVMDIIILQIHKIDWFDESIKRASIIVGILVGLFTVVKLYFDIISKAKDNKLKGFEIRRREEEERRFFEQKYKDQ
jgi:hypothetical protein